MAGNRETLVDKFNKNPNREWIESVVLAVGVQGEPKNRGTAPHITLSWEVFSALIVAATVGIDAAILRREGKL